jgi:hypothetical protein
VGGGGRPAPVNGRTGLWRIVRDGDCRTGAMEAKVFGGSVFYGSVDTNPPPDEEP